MVSDPPQGAGGGFGTKVTRTVSSGTVLTVGDANTTVLVDASGGNVQITLPTAVGINGKTFDIKKIDLSPNTVTIIGTGGQTIDRALSKVLNLQNEELNVVSDNANYQIGSFYYLLSKLNESEREAAINFGLEPGQIPDSNIRTFLDNYSKISKTTNWQQMSMSTAQGAAALDTAYQGSTFDGRYVYYAPHNSDTFVRFDTQGTSFTTAADWQQMSMSTAQGAAALEQAYQQSTFDGRYVYYAPSNSDTFVRFDTQGTSFTTAADWQKMSMSTAQGAAALDAAYIGATFDGRYVYYAPHNSDTFVRFDTQGTSFTTAADWQQMSMSTAQGAAALEQAYIGATFDGRYVYYAPFNSDTFLRFDTQGTSFTTAADWQKMSMSTAQGAAALDAAYEDSTFDGRYVYYAPFNSDTFLRFDTQGTSFTTAADWQKMSMSTAQGAAALDTAYVGATFDGRYVYYAPSSSDTFVRFDTQGTSFTTAADWQKMSMSTAQGAAALDAAYIGSTFDGRYVYYAPSNSDTFVRVTALPVNLS